MAAFAPCHDPSEIIVTPTLAEGSIAECLFETTRATKALATLLYHAHMSPDFPCQQHEAFAYGARALLEQQCMIYAAVQNAVETAQHAAEEAAVQEATERDANRAVQMEIDRQADRERRIFVANRAVMGLDTRVIAAVLNIKHAKVRQILDENQREIAAFKKAPETPVARELREG